MAALRWFAASVLLALASPAEAATDLVAFTAGQAARQGSFVAGGVVCNCAGELCRCQAPDDAALWPGICAELAREAGRLVAFGALGRRFDEEQLALCNREGTPAAEAEAVAPVAAAPASAPVAPQPPAEPPAVAPPATAAPPVAREPTSAPVAGAPPAGNPGLELCNGRDDDGDGEIDEGVRLTVWQDRDRDLHGDPARSRTVCPHELSPGWAVNDYDCDDADARRNSASGNCPPAGGHD